MIDFSNFKDNSALIIPFYLDSNEMFNYAEASVNIDIGALYNYINVNFEIKNKYQYYKILSLAKKEPKIYTAFLHGKTLSIRFIISKVDDFIILPIKKDGYESLSIEDFKKCALFWKESFFKVVQ